MTRPRLYVLIIALLAVLALLLVWLKMNTCTPPPPCGEADAKAGLCEPQTYPCTES